MRGYLKPGEMPIEVKPKIEDLCKCVFNGKEFYLKQEDVAPFIHEIDIGAKGGTTEKGSEN